jgi:hypothetical protein
MKARWIAVLPCLVASLFTANVAAGVTGHSAAECRAACRDQNLPASCAWLAPNPRRCLREALRACTKSQVPGPAQCLPPKDLPVCGSNHDCPYGALCIDATCQVLGCGSHNGLADCTGNNHCQGDKCIVADCSAVTANCPKGFHCEPASPPFDTISGVCVPDQPGVGYCSGTADCIVQGNFNPTCVQGICTKQPRRLGRCQTDDDCSRRCRRGQATTRVPRCDAASECLCTSCADDGQCGQLLACAPGRSAACLPSGACTCRKLSPGQVTTTTTTTTITTTTDTDAPSTTTTVPANNDICCCDFEMDQEWHCVHAAEPSPWLCYVPWPDCCNQPYTVCQ